MKICIYGAGAIGGMLGTRLAAAGNPVAAVARGATAQALRAHGWRLESGLARNTVGKRLIIGEPAGGESARVRMLAELLRAAGFDVESSPRIQRDLWYKLWGNMTMNPVSALTGATADRVLDDTLTSE